MMPEALIKRTLELQPGIEFKKKERNLLAFAV